MVKKDTKTHAFQTFEPSHFQKLETDSGKLFFVNKSGAKVVLKEKKDVVINLDKLTAASASGVVSPAGDDDLYDTFSTVEEGPEGDY